MPVLHQNKRFVLLSVLENWDSVICMQAIFTSGKRNIHMKQMAAFGSGDL